MMIDATDAEASKHFTSLIDEALSCKMTMFNDFCHQIRHRT